MGASPNFSFGTLVLALCACFVTPAASADPVDFQAPAIEPRGEPDAHREDNRTTVAAPGVDVTEPGLSYTRPDGTEQHVMRPGHRSIAPRTVTLDDPPMEEYTVCGSRIPGGCIAVPVPVLP